MKKFLSILKATTAGDMNIFNFDRNKSMSTFKKIRNIIIGILLSVLIIFSFSQYAYLFAEPLSKVGLTYVMLSMYIVITSVIVFMEGIYKSQGILFDSKDNDFLFSMPIKRKTIFAVRFVKLLLFQYIFDIIIMVPAFGIYAYFENPGYIFYIMSFIMLVLIPIIPTILACIIGYVIKAVSSIFRKRNIIQILLSLIFTMGLLLFSFQLQDFLSNIAQKAQSINGIISKIYYPAGLYISNMNTINIKELGILLAINIIPFILYIYLFSLVYFKIISKLSEITSKSNYNLKNKIFKSNSKLKALIKKELKRYFSSPIYILNTGFGLVMIIIFAISISINFETTLNFFTKGQQIPFTIEQIRSIFPKFYMMFLLFAISTVAITASSISLEGKTFELTKSLPVKTKTILLSKILSSNIISMPIILLSTIIVIVRLKFGIFDSIIALLISLILPNVIALLGLIINLIFPLLNAKSDTVVVKQSLSSLIATLGGMGISILPIIIYFAFKITMDVNKYISIATILYGIIVLILWQILMSYGVKKFYKLNS